jgi:hypothetical protein
MSKLDLDELKRRAKSRIERGHSEPVTSNETTLALIQRLREAEQLTATKQQIIEAQRAIVERYETSPLKQLIGEQEKRIEALERVREAAEALLRQYPLKRPGRWSGDDGTLELLWDRIDAVRTALAAVPK